MFKIVQTCNIASHFVYLITPALFAQIHKAGAGVNGQLACNRLNLLAGVQVSG